MQRPIPLKLVLLLLVVILPAHSASAEPVLIEERESSYNRIFVYENGPHVSLKFGHNQRFQTETVYDRTDKLALPVLYTQYMTVALAYTPKITDILEIGFGGGRTASYLHDQIATTSITSVELDPVVVELANKYFDVSQRPRLDITVGDGRLYLQRSKTLWDVIMVDAYRGAFVPFHLLTKEFFALAKSRLNPGGVMVQNIEPNTMLFDSAVATIRSVFDNVDAFRAGGNIVVVAYDGPSKEQSALISKAESLDREHSFRYPIASMFNDRRVLQRMPGGKILTDDFAPVESLLAIERHNRRLDEFSEAPPQ